MATETDDGTTQGSAKTPELPFGGADIDLGETLSRAERLRIATDRQLTTPLRIIWGDYRARIGLVTAVIYALLGTVGVWLTPAPYINMAPIDLPWIIGTNRLQAVIRRPLELTFWKYPLGTNHLGIDEVALMAHATPAMFKMMFAGAVLSMFIGVSLATVAGYKGGLVDSVLMTVTDVVMGIPGLPLVIILAAVVRPENPYMVGLILGIDNWPGLARTLRSQVLTLRNENYVESSRIMGLPTRNVIRKDLLPELMPYVLINFIGALTGIIGESVALYYLGILPFTNLNWGVALNQAYKQSIGLYGVARINQLIIPILTITLLTFGLTLLSQSLDRVFNPRVRARHAESVEDSDTVVQQ